MFVQLTVNIVCDGNVIVFGNVSLFSAVVGNKVDSLTYSTFKGNYIVNFSECG